MRPRSTILVVVVAHDEEASIGSVLADLEGRAPHADVVVVDDGSTDGTSSIARSAGVPVLRHAINLGYGSAVKTGYRYAARRSHDVVCLLDADGQHLPSFLEPLVEPVLRGAADIVIGSRFAGTAPYEGPVLRRLGTALFSRLTGLIIGRSITDVTSGFRAAGRRAVEFYARHYPVEFPEVEALLIARRAGLVIGEVEVSMRPRTTGRSLHTFPSVLLWPVDTAISMVVSSLRVPETAEDEPGQELDSIGEAGS